MIVGGGMLARACEKWKDEANVLIFASGVSDPHCVDQKEFFREWSLLDEWLKKSFPGFLLVYFSTTALEDMKRMDSPYALHKLNMENFITRHFKNYLILRLPVMVGPHINPHTFVSKFREWIKEDKRFTVQSNVVRELLDVEYLVELLTMMIDAKHTGRYSIDGIPTTPCDVAIILEGIMKKPAMFAQEGVTKLQVKDLLIKYNI
jgi:nucleoside-diphosphate-sugar epimerase